MGFHLQNHLMFQSISELQKKVRLNFLELVVPWIRELTLFKPYNTNVGFEMIQNCFIRVTHSFHLHVYVQDKLLQEQNNLLAKKVTLWYLQLIWTHFVLKRKWYICSCALYILISGKGEGEDNEPTGTVATAKSRTECVLRSSNAAIELQVSVSLSLSLVLKW